MKNFGLSVLVLAMTVAVCLSGCGQDDESDARRKTIGFSVLTMKNPFFKDLADDVTAAAEKHGYRVLIVNAEMDEAAQDRQILHFISNKVDAIILNPVNSKSVGESIKRANKAGIPVFTCDIRSLAPDAEVVCHVATDNYSGGRLAAQAVMEATGNKGKVAIIDHPEAESVILRVQGFKDELKKVASPIQIVKIVATGGVREESFNVTRDILASIPDLNAIFATNDESGLGAYAALKAQGRDKDIKIIAFDGTPEGRRAIKEGHIYADALQSTRLIGEGVVDAIIKHSQGAEVPKIKLIPTTLYRKSDADKDPTLGGYKKPAANTANQ